MVARTSSGVPIGSIEPHWDPPRLRRRRMLSRMAVRAHLRSHLRVASGAVLLAGVLAGCTGSDPEPEADPSAPSTPLESYDTAGLVVPRASFCAGMAEEAVADALGAAPSASSSYENGEPARVGEVRDVAHEYGCAYRAEDGTTARAWVFAPPVTRARARDLLALAGAERGCRPDRDAPAFGSPSTALECRGEGGTTVSWRGLFGDAWLSCSLTVEGPADESVVQRADRWCVAVATAASAG